MNAVRLLFLWEAYEPERGEYDEAYLGRMVAIARAAWRPTTLSIPFSMSCHASGSTPRFWPANGPKAKP